MKKLGKFLLFGAVVVTLLLVVVYFVATSDAFLRRVAIPRVLARADIDGGVESVSLKPFSSLAIRGLALRREGEFDVRVDTLRVRYRLLGMLRSGGLLVDELFVDGATISLVADPKPASPPEPVDEPPRKPQKGEPPQLRIANLLVANSQVEIISGLDGEEMIRVSDANLSVPLIANGAETTFEGSFGLAISRAEVDLRTARFSTVGTIGLSPSLEVERVVASLALTDMSGRAGGVELDGRSLFGELAATVAGQEVALDKLNLRQDANGVVESRIECSGKLASQVELSTLDVLVDLPNAAILDLIGALVGDYTFGNTSVQIAGHLAPNESGDLGVQVSGAVRDLTVASKRAGLVAGPPLNLSAELAADVAPDSGVATVSVGRLVLADTEEFLRLELNGPLSLPTRELEDFDPFAAGVDSGAAFRVQATRLKLDELAALAPTDLGLAGLAGVVSATIEAAFGETGLVLRGDLDAQGLRPPTRAIEPPRPLDVSLDWRGELRRDRFLTIDNLAARLGPSGETPACVVRLSGGVDTALSGRTSTLDIHFPETLDLERLLALLPNNDDTDEPSTDAEPDSSPDSPPPANPAADIPENLWLEVKLAAPHIVHGDVTITDLAVEAELRERIVRIPQAGLLVDGAAISLRAEVDLSDRDTPVYHGAIEADALPLGDLLARFRPQFPMTFRGGLKNVQLDVAGRGTVADIALPALTGEASYNVTEFEVLSMPAWATYLTAETMRLLGLGADDLRFHGGLGKLSVKDGRIEVLECRFEAALWRLAMAGEIPFSGNPDLTFTPVFRGPSARRLAAEGVPLADGGDGFQAAPALRLHGDVWNPVSAPLAIPRLLLDYSVALGKAPGEYRAVGQGIDVLRDIVKDPSEVGRDPARTLRGILGVIEEVEGARRERKQEDPADGQEDTNATDETDAPGKTADPIDNLLRDIFGR